MAINDIPIFSVLRNRMQWHQERQRLLAENVANADTPNFKPRDLAAFNPETAKEAQASGLEVTRTAPTHLASLAGSGSAQFRAGANGKFEIRPDGNAVSLEDQMMKVAENQMDFQAATALYTRSLGLLKMALGRGTG
jgi:flagellar basal-body rod protein FlgB